MSTDTTPTTRESDESLKSEKAEADEENPDEPSDDSTPELNGEETKSKDKNDILNKGTPTTPLEIAYHGSLQRKELQIQRLTREITKLKAFISKRKQTYKRKRKDEGAPTRALSAYNIFVQDRFSKLAKDNEEALKSSDADAILKRVPPASLVASTGNEWKELSKEEKKIYEDKYVFASLFLARNILAFFLYWMFFKFVSFTELQQIEKGIKIKWLHINRQKSKKTRKETRPDTICSFQHTFYNLSSQTLEYHQKGVQLPELLEMLGR